MGGTYVAIQRGIAKANTWGTIHPDGSFTWHGFTKANAMQTGTVVPSGKASLKLASPVMQSSVAGDGEPEPSAPPPSDPRAQCAS
jgi:hypothetical protein